MNCICFSLIIGIGFLSGDAVKALDENKHFDSILYQYPKDSFVDEDIRAIEENAISMKSSDYYMRMNPDGEVDSQVYTEEEYEKIKVVENSVTPFTLKPGTNTSASNSWIKMTLEAYSVATDQYYFYLNYEWKNSPNLKFSDVIALGHDSNFSFDTNSMRSYHAHSGSGGKFSSFSYTYPSNYPTNLYAKDNYVGAKFNLDTSPLYGLDIYSGYIKVDGRFTNPSTKSGTLSFLYGHSQATLGWSLSSSVSTSGECSLSFTPNVSISHDQFQHQDEFVR